MTMATARYRAAPAREHVASKAKSTAFRSVASLRTPSWFRAERMLIVKRGARSARGFSPKRHAVKIAPDRVANELNIVLVNIEVRRQIDASGSDPMRDRRDRARIHGHIGDRTEIRPRVDARLLQSPH